VLAQLNPAAGKVDPTPPDTKNPGPPETKKQGKNGRVQDSQNANQPNE